MTDMTQSNRKFILAKRPSGVPAADTFQMQEGPVPVPGAGEMLLRTRYLSLDPYMRNRIMDVKSYEEPLGVGETMVGGTVAEVVTSNIDRFEPGETVLSFNGWQDFAISDGEGIVSLGTNPEHPSWALGVLGMPGYTAYAGLLEIGAPQPGETLVVAAASGPVGATVGQIGKIKGCRVVGVAGGAEKCAHVRDVLGFDDCIDHRDPDFADKLAAACPGGIDIYFENVGGDVLYAVLPLLNPFARVPVCGIVGWYNLDGLPDGPDHGPAIMGTLLRMKVKMQGFIIHQSFPASLFQSFQKDMTGWIGAGRVKYFEDVTEGLENAPFAMNAMLTGKSFGKTVVKV